MKIQNLCRNLRQRIMPFFCFVPLWERIRSGADCRLAEQIHNRFKILAGFDLGTTYKQNKDSKKDVFVIVQST
jgi:hypothetical protein